METGDTAESISPPGTFEIANLVSSHYRYTHPSLPVQYAVAKKLIMKLDYVHKQAALTNKWQWYAWS